MIYPLYYTKDRAVNHFFNGTLKHFERKERTKVLESKPYTVKDGDNIYNVAVSLFGEPGEYHWTIISDINGNRMPTDLQVGETIQLPKVILDETFNRLPDYERNITTSTPVQL